MKKYIATFKKGGIVLKFSSKGANFQFFCFFYCIKNFFVIHQKNTLFLSVLRLCPHSLFDNENINTDIGQKFGSSNDFRKKIDELNQETETLMDEIERWQT